MNPLEAMEALTKSTRVKAIRDNGEVVTVEHDPLLVQLEQAIRGSMIGGDGGSSSLAAERGVLNSQALFEFKQIEHQLNRWCFDVGVEPTKDASETLRKWYIGWLNTTPAPEFHCSEMRRWAKAITDILDPPRRVEHPDPCPACDAKTWFDEGSGETKTHPILITYRTDLGEAEMKGSCRACGKEWGVRELAWELEAKNTT